MRAFLFLVAFAISMSCGAATATQLVKIVVPSGFDGPQSMSPGPGGHVDAYIRQSPGSGRGTLLEITTYDSGSKLTGTPTAQLGNTAEHFLLQFLGGVERRRTNFHASKPKRVLLGKIPAARVEWTGRAQGLQMSGVMYCVIVGAVVVVFHTQGFQDSPASDRAEAIRAIESVTFRSDG